MPKPENVTASISDDYRLRLEIDLNKRLRKGPRPKEELIATSNGAQNVVGPDGALYHAVKYEVLVYHDTSVNDNLRTKLACLIETETSQKARVTLLSVWDALGGDFSTIDDMIADRWRYKRVEKDKPWFLRKKTMCKEEA